MSQSVDTRRVRGVFYAVRGTFMLAHAGYIATFALYLKELELADILLPVLGLGFLFEWIWELLTGQFSDRVGRGRAVLLSALCYLAAFLFFALPSLSAESTGDMARPASIASVCVGQALLMLGASFFSGTTEAWV